MKADAVQGEAPSPGHQLEHRIFNVMPRFMTPSDSAAISAVRPRLPLSIARLRYTNYHVAYTRLCISSALASAGLVEVLVDTTVSASLILFRSPCFKGWLWSGKRKSHLLGWRYASFIA